MKMTSLERIAKIVGAGHVPWRASTTSATTPRCCTLRGTGHYLDRRRGSGRPPRFRTLPIRDLGFKAVASALSDLAAMGARPRGRGDRRDRAAPAPT